MFVLDDELLYKSTFASLLIILGVVLLNTVTTLEKNLNLNNINDKQWHFAGLLIGALMFMVGWVNIANVTSINRETSEATILYYSSLAIMVSAGAMKYMMYTKQMNMPWIPLFPATFVLSWLALGMLVGDVKIKDVMNLIYGNMDFNELDINKKLGLLIGPLVIGSMMVALPWQREKCVADGPGMPMFVMAWGLLILLNSNRMSNVSDDVDVDVVHNEINDVIKKNNNLDKNKLNSIFNTIIDKHHINKISQLDFNAS